MTPETITRALKLATSSQLASELASRSTPAKAEAARLNGKKGGWPKGRPRKPKIVENNS
jgi:DNA invertase Pin-like site-specific DNA recombinase